MYFIQRRKPVHWIVSLAILLGALAPGISQALSLANTGHGFAVEICSANGNKLIQRIGDEGSSQSPAMGRVCPYCVVQPIYVLPAVSVFEFAAVRHDISYFQTTNRAPQFISEWLILPSRAPPKIL